MWRFYFRYRMKDPKRMTQSSRLNWEACARAVSTFTPLEIELLEKYYMTGYGNYDDMKAVNDFAAEHRIEQAEAWDVIKRANYEVVVERGLMDRREAGDDA